MNTEKKVCPLVVMDLAASLIDQDNPNSPARLREARAKVAELVAVAREVLAADDAALLALRDLGVKAPAESHELPGKLRAALAAFSEVRS